MKAILRFLRQTISVIQMTLPKIGIGWMFALLTSNFNRVAIHELGILAVLITAMLALYQFLAPFQVAFGRMADRHPIFGFRRGPYLFTGLLISAIVFPFLPDVAVAMGDGSILAIFAGFALLTIFGVGFAMAGNAHLALIVDNTEEKSRGITIALVWAVQIISIIISASVIKRIMPVYDIESMQQLYNLTIPIVLISTVASLIFNEKRLTQAGRETVLETSLRETPEGSIITMTINLLQSHETTRNFFWFIILSTMGVFLQDNILEVFGAEVFGMTVAETTSFQQLWGGGVLLSMMLVGIITMLRPFNKQSITLIGSVATAGGLCLLTFTSTMENQALLNPALFILGLGTGVYTIGALSVMMKLTTTGAVATYMGLWGMAQSFGSGFSSFFAGALHSSIIGTGLMAPAQGYGAIFFFEAFLMLWGAWMLLQVSVKGFQEDLNRSDLEFAMEMGA
ncbi:MAG: BCD family MFS transporter [Chloroflexota bacterium]